MRVESLHLAECSIPLPRPIELGPVRILTRDYVALRLVAEDGSVGEAIGYPRGSALFDEARMIAPYFLGTSVMDRRASYEQAKGRLVNTYAVVIRALSLFEIALTDLAAKQMGQPLHHVLGGFRSKVPVMAVAGYYLATRSIDDVVREVKELVDEGFARVKVMLHGHDSDFDRRYAAAIAQAIPGGAAVDAHWSWTTIPEALRTCRQLDDLGLNFIEDPFGAHRNTLMPQLASQLRTPLAAGEDMIGPEALLELARSAKVLRIDATTCGGIMPAFNAMEASALQGDAVLPHVFPTLHAQLAGASPAIEMIEHIPTATGADPIGQLLLRPLHIEGGFCHIDQEPGAGMALNWEKVEQTAVRVHSTANSQ